ncbi:PREDICTED: phospholipase A1-IIgamma [Theobroma cacao]|uniref:Phospholipase A1 n=1 Tax=Theobroma cacao TaxID=3641 RepID=A0AB32V084_THECC|nr:PREDICTED: phospholipase A1-IIgamma [Theobroma cacao]
MDNSIATRWRDLSGEKNWKDLLHPVDPDLRRYVIHYGERAGAAGDLFNDTMASRGFGYCLYPPDEFFSRAGLENGNPFMYEVTNFFYGAADSNDSNWFGYVAVATDEGKTALGRRDILVSWRGTGTEPEWIDDARFFTTPAKELFGTDHAKVHSGFLAIYTGKVSNSPYNETSARDQVLKAVRKLVDKYQNEDISITVVGHSLGAALATLNATDIAAKGYNKPTDNSNKTCMVTAFAYASPHVGNQEFKEVIDGLIELHILRITNSTDIIPKLPVLLGYTDVGENLAIDTTKSPYLRQGINAHNLEVHLHGVAGVQESGEFKLEVDRDIALINKKIDGLQNKYKIPPEWWNHEKFKNMVQMDTGRWQFVDCAYVPDPPNDYLQ